MNPANVPIELRPLTPRQRALLEVIRGLNPKYRYTLTVTCNGKEPIQVEQIVEHRDIDLRPPDGKDAP